MKEVSKKDYAVLSKYHKGEIKYFIHLTETRPTKPTKLKTHSSSLPSNRLVQLTLKRPKYRAGTSIERSYGAVKDILKHDPTRMIGRADLVKRAKARYRLKTHEIQPAVSTLLKDGLLAYSQGA